MPRIASVAGTQQSDFFGGGEGATPRAARRLGTDSAGRNDSGFFGCCDQYPTPQQQQNVIHYHCRVMPWWHGIPATTTKHQRHLCALVGCCFPQAGLRRAHRVPKSKPQRNNLVHTWRWLGITGATTSTTATSFNTKRKNAKEGAAVGFGVAFQQL